MGKGKLRGTILEDSVQEQDIHIAQEQSKRKRIQRTLLNPSTGKSKKASSITISKKHRKPSHDGDDQGVDKTIKEAKKKKKEIDDQESEQDGDSDGDDDEDEGVEEEENEDEDEDEDEEDDDEEEEEDEEEDEEVGTAAAEAEVAGKRKIQKLKVP